MKWVMLKYLSTYHLFAINRAGYQNGPMNTNSCIAYIYLCDTIVTIDSPTSMWSGELEFGSLILQLQSKHTSAMIGFVRSCRWRYLRNLDLKSSLNLMVRYWYMAAFRCTDKVISTCAQIHVIVGSYTHKRRTLKLNMCL